MEKIKGLENIKIERSGKGYAAQKQRLSEWCLRNIRQLEKETRENPEGGISDLRRAFAVFYIMNTSMSVHMARNMIETIIFGYQFAESCNMKLHPTELIIYTGKMADMMEKEKKGEEK